MTLEACEATRPYARAKLQGGIAPVTAVTGYTRGVGAAIGRGLAGWVGGVARPDDVACVLRLFADGRSQIPGRVWLLDGRGEV